MIPLFNTVSAYIGDTIPLDFVVKIDCVIVNISSADLYFTLKRHFSDDDADAVARKTSDDDGGIVITDGPAGECTVTLSPIDTVSFTDDTILVWDLRMKNGEDISTLETGKLILNRVATRSFS